MLAALLNVKKKLKAIFDTAEEHCLMDVADYVEEAIDAVDLAIDFLRDADDDEPEESDDNERDTTEGWSNY